MSLLIALFVVAVALTIAVGVVAHRSGRTLAGGPRAWGVAVADRLGRPLGGAVIAVAGWVVTLLVSVGLGFLAKAIENPVDHPVFNYIHDRVGDVTAKHAAKTAFSKIMAHLTQMGSTAFVELLCLVAVVLFACAYRRRPWLPVIAIVAAFLAERYLQKWLGTIVDRGHPPTTHGTFPSGGVGRLLGDYSIILALALVLLPALSRAWRAGLWTGLVTAGVVEAYARVYLSQHWFTDALFGLVFGGLLLLTNVTAVAALTAPLSARRREETAPSASEPMPDGPPAVGRRSAASSPAPR